MVHYNDSYLPCPPGCECVFTLFLDARASCPAPGVTLYPPHVNTYQVVMQAAETAV